MRPWVKWYTKILRDPQVAELTDRQGWTWARLLALAGTIENEGFVGTAEEIGWHLRIEDLDALTSDLQVLAGKGFMREADGWWEIVNFERLQARPPSAEPAAVTERVRRCRAKKKGDGLTLAETRYTNLVTSLDQIRSDQITGEEEELPPEAVAEATPFSFEGWQARLQEPGVGSNRTAVLVAMHAALYPGRDLPAFSYMGGVARKVGGAGRLAELLWQTSTRPPTGDVLAYCVGVANGNGKRRGRAEPTTEGFRAQATSNPEVEDLETEIILPSLPTWPAVMKERVDPAVYAATFQNSRAELLPDGQIVISLPPQRVAWAEARLRGVVESALGGYNPRSIVFQEEES